MGYTIAYKTQNSKDFRPITFVSGGIDSARKEAVREHRSGLFQVETDLQER